MEITIEDIISFWTKIVPEASSKQELRELCIKASGEDIIDLANRVLKPDRDYKDILHILDEEKFYKLDEIVSEYRDTIPFFFFYEPYINTSLRKWFDSIYSLDILYDINMFLKQCIYNLLRQLASMAARTLILEINIARMSEKLQGNTEKERFSYFHYKMLTNREYCSSLYFEYYELSKIMAQKTNDYFAYIYEMLTNIKSEVGIISRHYNIEKEKLIIESISTSAGDEHISGKAVAIINFIENFKLVYKPRNLGFDIGFQNILEWIEIKSKGSVLPMKKLKIIERREFGLVEYVDNNECYSVEEIKEFYIKIGQYIAILHSLNAVDFHSENIIADGKDPVLIDLETLFHPYVKIHSEEMYTESEKVANEVIENSVQSIGILPFYIMNEAVSDAKMDISGLGGAMEQKSPYKSYVVNNEYTDRIEVSREHLNIEPDKNNPKLNGEIQKSENFVDSIIQGFKACYATILDNRIDYSRKVNNAFIGNTNRIIIRPTRDYTQLLNTSYHPDLLRNEEDRIVFFSRLGGNVSEERVKILRLELKSLLNGEVPCFNCKIDSKHVYDVRNEVYVNFIEECPIDIVKKRIASFSDEDLVRQIKFIEVAFKTKESDYEKDKTFIDFNNVELGSSNISKEKYIELAVQMGDYILKDSILDKSETNNRTWISAILKGRNESCLVLNPIGDDLYNGNAGVALFLIYLGYSTGQDKYVEAASQALESRRVFIDKAPKSYPFSIGAFNGLSGTIYTLDKLITYGKRSCDIEYIGKYVRYLDDIIYMDKQYDLMGGALGCIAVLLPMIRRKAYPQFESIMKSVVTKCCKHLIKNGYKADVGGITWGDIMKSTGFSHGNAGVVAYLKQLANENWLQDVKNLDFVIDEALQFERALYVPEVRNWYKTNEKEEIAFGWCHGAPGILLSKCLLKSFGFHDNKLDDEIEHAIQTTKNNGFGNNPSLCHGDLGNLEILYIASKVLKDEKLQEECMHVFDDIFEKVIAKRWNGQSYRGIESFSLMVGLAGFGYSLLKFYKPDSIPSILCLE